MSEDTHNDPDDQRKVLVTHHAPDLDAIGAVWMLKRFDSQNYANAKITFVNPGERLSLRAAEQLEVELHQVTHLDTGLGRFDHHQPERGKLHISATSLTYDHVCSLDPNLRQDQALQMMTEYITDIDHFSEVNWPESGSYRESFAIYNLIRGLEFIEMHDDDSQLHFGLTCLDSAYAILTRHVAATESIEDSGKTFTFANLKALGLESRNDDTIKLAQKQGYDLVIRKDPKEGNIRIKARPDTQIDLKDLHQAILQQDSKGNWFYHPSGKMLLNGSKKHDNQQPSPLTLDQVIDMIKQVYDWKIKQKIHF